MLNGDDHVTLRSAVRLLAGLYDAWGKPGKAAEYRELLIESQPVTARD
ncbi:MAG: hypothetical protein ACYTFF_04515 [Planctomycetota bacterium]|jgi:hypothetical protein